MTSIPVQFSALFDAHVQVLDVCFIQQNVSRLEIFSLVQGSCTCQTQTKDQADTAWQSKQTSITPRRHGKEVDEKEAACG